MADLGAEFNLATQLADKLKFVNSLIEQKGTLDDEALKRAKELVSTVGKLKGEYNTTKDIQNDAAKVADKLATTQNTMGAILKNNNFISRQTLQGIANQSNGVEELKDKLAQKNAEAELGSSNAEREADLLRQQIRTQQKDLATRLQSLSAEEKQVLILMQQEALYGGINKHLEEETQRLGNIENAMGLGGAALGAFKNTLDQMGAGGLANALGLDSANAAMEEAAKKLTKNGEETVGFAGKLAVLKVGAKEMGKNLLTAVTDPLAVISFLVKGFFDIDKAQAQLSRTTGLSKFQMMDFTDSVQAATRNVEGLSVPLTDVLTITKEISDQMGMNAQILGTDNLIEASRLKEQMGLAAAEAGSLAQLSALSGNELADVGANTFDIVNNFNKTNGTALNASKILKDVATTSKTIQVQLGMNPEKLASAATEAAKLGLSLQAVSGIADKLLDFESQISSELEAELLTGQSINLEKARTLALNNDLQGLAEELSNQAAVQEAFASGNRIQQQAIAKAMGMSVDEMSQMFYQQQLTNMSAAEFRSIYGEQNYEAAKNLDIQQQIQKAIQSLQQSFLPLLNIIIRTVQFLERGKIITVALGVAAAAFAINMGAKLVTSIQTAIANMTTLLGLTRATSQAASGAGGPGGGGAAGGPGGLIMSIGRALARVGQQFANVVKGGLALGIAGLALAGGFALALRMVQGVDPVQMLAFAGAISVFAGAMALVGNFSAQIIQGALGLGILAVSLIPAAFAFSLLEGLDTDALIAFSVALPLLSLAAAGLGFVAPFIMAGAGALAVLGLALIPAAIGFNMIQGLDVEAILSFAAGIGVLAVTTAAMGAAAPFILAGSLALGALGLALVPLSIGFQNMAEVNAEGLVESLGMLAGLGPSLALVGTSLLSIGAGLGAVAIGGLVALPIIKALTGLGTVSTGISSIFGGGEGEASTGNDPVAQKLDELNANVVRLIGAVESGGVVEIDGNRAGTAFSLSATNVA